MLSGLVQIRGVQEPTGAVGTGKDRGESEILDNEEHKVLAREIPSTENATLRSEVSVSFIDTLEAFDYATTTGKTLRSILESDGIPKVFFDVRNDSAAMFHQYQVELAGIYDLQVMEVGTRARPGKYLASPAKYSRDVPMTPTEKTK
ncbi:hypothetical protein AnigIFM60653_009782 [Aspergillus niger]|nr:hypothetical protein AnigIFM60653_009782 [Aspergillus niger]